MANGPALHEDDRMVAVLARDGRRQPHDESGCGPACHLLETVCGQVMTFSTITCPYSATQSFTTPFRTRL